jgi:transcriptional regulator with PAS, ATPase and Fis domain
VSVDVRVIAAANVDLLQAVEQQRFRADLYYRLNVVPIRLPAVREREGDIPLLIEHFVDSFCQQEGLPLKMVAGAAMGRLCEYAWPGNVRQIEHAVEMAVALSGTRRVLTFEDFRLQETPAKSGSMDVVVPSCGIHFDDTVQHLERSLIQQALQISKGNRGRAADLLRLKRTTLLAKIKALGLGEIASEAVA